MEQVHDKMRSINVYFLNQFYNSLMNDICLSN